MIGVHSWVLPVVLGADLIPAPLEVAQNAPKEPAVHQAGRAGAPARAEGVRLGVLEMVGDLVKERGEKLFERPLAFLAVVSVDPDQVPGLVITPQGSPGGPRVDLKRESAPGSAGCCASRRRNSGPISETGSSTCFRRSYRIGTDQGVSRSLSRR